MDSCRIGEQTPRKGTSNPNLKEYQPSDLKTRSVPRAHLRAGPMGDRAPSMVMQTLRDIREEGAPADGGVPGRSVHAELLEMREVDDDRAILAADAEVGISVPATARLDLEPLLRGALYNRGDLVRAPGARYRCGGDAESCIVWLYGGGLVE